MKNTEYLNQNIMVLWQVKAQKLEYKISQHPIY